MSRAFILFPEHFLHWICKHSSHSQNETTSLFQTFLQQTSLCFCEPLWTKVVFFLLRACLSIFWPSSTPPPSFKCYFICPFFASPRSIHWVTALSTTMISQSQQKSLILISHNAEAIALHQIRHPVWKWELMEVSRTQSLLVPPSQSGGWTETQVLHKISFAINPTLGKKKKAQQQQKKHAFQFN